MSFWGYGECDSGTIDNTLLMSYNDKNISIVGVWSVKVGGWVLVLVPTTVRTHFQN